MKAKRLTLTALSLVLFAGLSFTSCKKDSKGDTDIESSENNALAESQFNDVTTISDQAANSGSVAMGAAGSNGASGSEGTLTSACATVTIDTVSNPHTVTVDFGSTNCLCNDGRYRRGKIISSFTGRYRDAGTVITITLDNYFVNDNQIKGSKKITNQGLNNSGNLVYKVEVDGQIIKANNQGTVTWVSTRQREWIAGSSTMTPADDVYSITGSASGTNAAGTAYTVTITQPLVRKMSCRWFESGVLDITPAGKPKRTLDYGNTGCDANATVTILGYSYPIVLR